MSEIANSCASSVPSLEVPMTLRFLSEVSVMLFALTLPAVTPPDVVTPFAAFTAFTSTLTPLGRLMSYVALLIFICFIYAI